MNTNAHWSPAPEVGKIVHYGAITHNDGGVPNSEPEPWAAIITKINEDGSINLYFFLPSENPLQVLFGSTPAYASRVPYAEALTAEHWSWPPSVMLALQTALSR